jgi:hypothetical protein
VKHKSGGAPGALADVLTFVDRRLANPGPGLIAGLTLSPPKCDWSGGILYFAFLANNIISSIF